MNKEFWWKEEPLTISAIQANLKGESKRALEEYVSKCAFNTEQLFHAIAKAKMTYYAQNIDGDFLTEYLKKTREKGIREIVYYNIHCYDNETSEKHPEWWLRDKDGESILAYQTFHMNCMNIEGEWFKHFISNLKSLCAHDIDGVFLDGPVVPERGCYCEHCQKSFFKRFGHSIYQSTRLERQTERIETVTEFVKTVSQTIKKINPDVALYLNNSALRADVVSCNSRKLYDYVDILGAEAGFYVPKISSDGMWKTSAYMKHLSAIAGNKNEKPIVNFFAGNESGLVTNMHTAAETVLTYAQSIANGANIWYGVHCPIFDVIETETVQKAREMNTFILQNRDIFAPSKTCARIAVMWSQATANNYASSVLESDFTEAKESGFAQRGDHRKAVFAVVDILERHHVQFDIVDEKNIIDGDLSCYQAVILPEIACLDDETADAIRNYVFNGGVILGNFDIGMYDEYGVFLGKSKLSDLFGIQETIKMHESRIGRSLWIKKAQSGITKSLADNCIPAPKLNLECKYNDKVKTLLHATYPIESVYGAVDLTVSYPCMVESIYGKGKAYYLSGNYAETKEERNILAYQALIVNFIEQNSTATVVAEGAGLYEIVLRKQKDRFILHIVNLTGAMERPIKQIVPLYNVKICLNLSGFSKEDKKYLLRSVRQAKLQDISIDKQEISFIIDCIRDYEVVVIE